MIASKKVHVSIGWAFLPVAAAVYAVSTVLASRLPHLAHPSVVASAMTIDLVLVVPAAFYLLVVRPRRWPLVSLVPILVASVFLAAKVLPSDHQGGLQIAELLLVPAEIALLAWIGTRATRAMRDASMDPSLDGIDRLRAAALDVARSRIVADVVASEIAVLYYALGSWRAKPHVPEGFASFSQHRRSAHGAILFALLLVMAAEGIGLHLLLSRWSALAAWIFTAGTAYAVLWLVGDYRATVLRPILVGESEIVFRAGLRHALRVQRSHVARIDPSRPDPGTACARLSFVAVPTHWVVLSEPAISSGPYGVRRSVRALGLVPDDPDGLLRAIRPEGDA